MSRVIIADEAFTLLTEVPFQTPLKLAKASESFAAAAEVCPMPAIPIELHNVSNIAEKTADRGKSDLNSNL
jgi:hypothetical protein